MIVWLFSGLWILFGCAEAAHLITMMTNKSLHTYTILSTIFIVCGLSVYIGAYLFWRRKHRGSKAAVYSKDRMRCTIYGVFFVLLTILTIGHFWRGYVPDLQDAVYEITLGNIQSGSIMTLHPFTGTQTDAAMPFRMRILGLPSLYSALVTISQQSAYTIMCKVIPTIVWVMNIMLCWAFARKLFYESCDKCLLFVGVAALVYLATSGSDGMIGQRLLYSGFSAETIRAALLIPYTIYVCLDKKWFLAVLAVIVEACLVWTTFGIGYCFMITACMFGIQWLSCRRGVDADRME